MERTLDKLLTKDLKIAENYRAWCVWIFIALMAASAVAVRASIMTTSVRLLLVATLAFGLLNAVLFFLTLVKSHPRIVYPSVFFIVFILMWGILGSKPHDVDILRGYYQNRLSGFQNVKYVWGGETNSGIDCSGLARVALWQAMFKEGLMQANPRLLGPMFWKFWFRDISARDMLKEKYGYTKVIGGANQIAGCDTSKLRVGDMAVTTDGVHVLIYYGENKWIDAAPDHMRVVVMEAPADSKRGWFNVPVTFVRWWILEEPSGSASSIHK